MADVSSPTPWPAPEQPWPPPEQPWPPPELTRPRNAHRAAPDRLALPLLVDCDSCRARGPACDDCVVSVFLGPPRERLHLDADELSALDALAGAGLVPPLRLVRSVVDPSEPIDDPSSPEHP